jgi:hypothetical protein
VTLRFRKSFRLAPGLRLSVGKGTASLRVGSRRAGVSASTSGRRTGSVSLGNGLGWLFGWGRRS